MPELQPVVVGGGAGDIASAARPDAAPDLAPREEESPPLFVIQPTRGFLRFDLRELWHYRDLLYFLTWREISIRYKQTVLGFAWAIIQPVMTMVVFTIFLGKLAKVPSDGVPYPVFSYLGLLPWMYFSNAVTRSSMSLVANSNLLSKVYFPRILMPLSGTLSALVDFAIAFVVLIVLMLGYGMVPAPSILLIIPLLVVTAISATGVGMWFAALNVKYRDIQHAIPFLIQVWMYASPVVYSASSVPAKYRPLFGLNPMAGIIDAYRACALGRPIDWSILAASTLSTLVLTAIGAWQFRRMERHFADIV